MTAYHGGKTRGGKEIAEIIASVAEVIEENTNFYFKGYWEPFCGMCGVYRHIPTLLSNRYYLASDIHPSLILMWQALQKGWKPPKKVTKRMYEQYRTRKGSCPEKAYIGFGHSFGGIYFKGFIEDYGHAPSTKKYGNLLNTASKLMNVEFIKIDYKNVYKMVGWIIYCDPPYAGSNESKFKTDDENSGGGNDETSIGTFSSDHFWEWARATSRNNLVFVSEYFAPVDFQPVYSRKIQATQMSGKNCKSNEYLFIHEKWVPFLKDG